MIFSEFEDSYKYLEIYSCRIFDRYRISNLIFNSNDSGTGFSLSIELPDCLAPILLFEHSASASFRTGGKPSTWFPPGGLVEHISDDRKYHKSKLCLKASAVAVAEASAAILATGCTSAAGEFGPDVRFNFVFEFKFRFDFGYELFNLNAKC